MEICRAEYIDLKHTIAPIKHSCDTGGGSSGSAQFVTRNGKMIFVAININHQNKQSDGDDYYADTNYNGATPVSGRLLKAIRDAMKP